MREAVVMLLSVALTCAVIGNAYYQKKQFYPSVVYITKSNPSMAVMYIQGFILAFMMNTFLRKIFFGNLRAAELEHLLEKVWYAVTETCLAFTVFRDDFSPKFIALFTLLLFLKSFHWLAEDRVDYMERSPVITFLFHLRVATLLGLLFTINLTMLHYAYQSTLAKGASVQLVFGFEYAILLTVVFNITIKYMLHTIDLQSENPWDNKPVFLLYTELIIGLLKVILYFAFVIIMVRIYTLPLFAFRPMYYTMRNFKKAFHNIVMSRRAIRNMNTLYPDATPEELAAADNVCIICREEMVAASKKLPCNHIFHTACLQSWFQRQQTCPTCRLNILRPTTNNNVGGQRQDNQPQVAPQTPPAPQAQGANQAGGFQLPGFWAGLQVPLGQQPQQQQQQQSSNNATSANNIPLPPFQTIPGGIPLFAPPFPPMIPPMSPLPTPPPNLTALSEEELRAMEGNLREAVEARIQTLRRIQLLLDAANAMMGQYQAAAATANIPPATTVTTTATATATLAAAAAASTTTTETTESNTTQVKENIDMTKDQIPSTSKCNSEEGKNVDSVQQRSSSFSKDLNSTNLNTSTSNSVTPSTSRTETNASTQEQEMLRKRRLQKFSTSTTPVTTE